MGKIEEIALLDKVLEKVFETTNCKVMISMDANARSMLWDNNAIYARKHSRSKKMGEKLEEVIMKYSLVCHNTGEPTYRSGEIETAPDVTLPYGIVENQALHWKVIDDDIGSPHCGMLMKIGEKRCKEKIS